jgi:hypothetical protein
MQWPPRGAHLLLQIRTHVLNEEWEHTFRRGIQVSGYKNQRNQLKKPSDPMDSNALQGNPCMFKECGRQSVPGMLEIENQL